MDAVLGRQHPERQPKAVSAGTLVLDGVSRRFDAHVAVDALSLDIAPGELLALVGASGSGKTTTLRLVAGYETPDAGRVVLDGRDITGVPPQRRDFGMVFQHYALFPHMTVGENVAFGLQARGRPRSARRALAERALATVGLPGAADRAVQQLSGGEQQRVALARALVIEPRVLLLDEPLSNLDPTLRRSMRDELRGALRRLGVTALFVTHDQEDAFAIADRVALIRAGRLLQAGTPEELYDAPASRDVAEFIGRATLVEGDYDGSTIMLRIGDVTSRITAVAPPDAPLGPRAVAVLRPDALAFAPPGTPGTWAGVVTSRRFAGALLVHRVRLADELEVELQTSDRTVRDGDRVGVRVTRDRIAVVGP